MLIFFSMTSTTNNTVKNIVDVKQNTNNIFDGFKVLFFNYLFFSLPHYFTIFLSFIVKSVKSTLLYLLNIANIVLVGFASYIAISKYLHYHDLSLLWIFYLPISLMVIFITWIIVRERAKS